MNEEKVCNEHMESIDSTDWQQLSLPALRIEQPGGSDQLLIRIITLKRSTDLTSKLFEVLEEENLDVLHFNRFSTEETILHTIQVKVVILIRYKLVMGVISNSISESFEIQYLNCCEQAWNLMFYRTFFWF